MLRALIQKEGLQENIIITNPVIQSEVPKFISMCDVCIIPLPDHPYWRFQSPLKLLEYLAMEKVVILTDIPAHRAVLGEAKCGIYISSAKPMEIVKAIENAYLNKENLEEWGKIGRQIIVEKFTWAKVARDLENYLLSIEVRVN
jgi:glycosyltransferase involved in cell wall biosynthesis